MAEHERVAAPADDFLHAVLAAMEAKDWEEARAACAAHLETDPDAPEPLFAQALICLWENNLGDAAGLAAEAHAKADDVREIADLLAVIHGLAGDLNTAVYYAKLAITVPADPRLAALVPSSLPTFARVLQMIEEQPLLRRGAAAMAAGRLADAEHWLRQHLVFNPESREAYLGVGSCLLAQGLPAVAVDSLRAARHRLPFDAEIAGMLGKALAATAAFGEAAACHRAAAAQAPDDAGVHAVALIDRLHDPDADAGGTSASFHHWGRRFGVSRTDVGLTPSPKADGFVTIGYLIAGRGTAPEASALADILSRRNSRRFQVVGFGDGPLTHPANCVFQKCVDRWQDVSDADPLTLQTMVRAENVDLVVDLAGFSAPDLLTAFGGRMAPAQAAWLDSPCGTGLAGFDFALTDRFVEARAAANERSETAVHLGLGCVLTALPTEDLGAVTVRDAGEVVFAVDAGLADIHWASVECWANVLHRLPGSGLILRDHDFRRAENRNKLIGLFANFGLAHRVDIVTEDSPGAFYSQADIALLPVPFPQPQAAIDALWWGLPVICAVGDGPHTRLAGSLLHHLGLGEHMIGESPEEVPELASKWTAQADRRQAFRVTIREYLRKARMFDPAARAADLEAAYERMWQRVRDRSQTPGGRAKVA